MLNTQINMLTWKL